MALNGFFKGLVLGKPVLVLENRLGVKCTFGRDYFQYIISDFLSVNSFAPFEKRILRKKVLKKDQKCNKIQQTTIFL